MNYLMHYLTQVLWPQVVALGWPLLQLVLSIYGVRLVAAGVNWAAHSAALKRLCAQQPIVAAVLAGVEADAQSAAVKWTGPQKKAEAEKRLVAMGYGKLTYLIEGVLAVCSTTDDASLNDAVALIAQKKKCGTPACPAPEV